MRRQENVVAREVCVAFMTLRQVAGLSTDVLPLREPEQAAADARTLYKRNTAEGALSWSNDSLKRIAKRKWLHWQPWGMERALWRGAPRPNAIPW